jgi:hypothetical protein
VWGYYSKALWKKQPLFVGGKTDLTAKEDERGLKK